MSTALSIESHADGDSLTTKPTHAYTCDVEKISEIIRAAMLNSGKSLRQIAEASGLDHTVLSRFARKERTLSQAALDTLAAQVGVTARAARRAKKGAKE